MVANGSLQSWALFFIFYVFISPSLFFQSLENILADFLRKQSRRKGVNYFKRLMGTAIFGVPPPLNRAMQRAYSSTLSVFSLTPTCLFLALGIHDAPATRFFKWNKFFKAQTEEAGRSFAYKPKVHQISKTDGTAKHSPLSISHPKS